MTPQETLQKAIEIARNNNWNDNGFFTTQGMLKRIDDPIKYLTDNLPE